MIYGDDKIIENLEDDIGFEDLTTNILVSPDKWSQAEIECKDEGILAGIDVALFIIEYCGLHVSSHYMDGDVIHNGDIILKFEGDARSVLTCERTILNYLMHLSGIATLVHNTLERVHSVNPNVRLACTRKTTPGLQKLEKQAVTIGGGDSHRFRLDDCVMIKDNHIEVVGSVVEAISLAKEKVSFTKKIEVEVESLDDALKASMFGADIILLDNMSPSQIEEVLDTLKKRHLRDNVLIEASGGITPDNIMDYAKLEVDVISSGFITNSARSIDMSLHIIN